MAPRCRGEPSPTSSTLRPARSCGATKSCSRGCTNPITSASFLISPQSRAVSRGAWRDEVFLGGRGFGTRRDHQTRSATVPACTESSRLDRQPRLDGGRQLRIGYPSRRGEREVARVGNPDRAPVHALRPRRSARIVMQGLILAGGRGSRLAADGVEAPKALVEVGGRPQIVNLIDTFAELGCASITCMVREGITVDVPKPTVVRTCRTPSSLHTLVAGLAIVPPGPVFCAMVDTVMPAADWRRVYRGVTDRLATGRLPCSRSRHSWMTNCRS